MPVTPHRFLSLGRLTLLAGKAWQDQDGTRSGGVQGVAPKNYEGKGLVNSKLLPVTRCPSELKIIKTVVVTISLPPLVPHHSPRSLDRARARQQARINT